MALSNNGIVNVRKDVNDMNTHTKILSQSSANLSDFLKKDGNYQFFKAGTDKGNSVDNALNETLTTITEQLAPAISSLESAIHSFLDRQEAENRRMAARGIAEEKTMKQQEHNLNQSGMVNPRFKNINLMK